MLVLLIGGLSLASSQRAPDPPTDSQTLTNTTVSTSTMTSSENTKFTTFELKQPVLNSDQFTGDVFVIKLNLSDVWSQRFKDSTGLAVKNSTAYLVIQANSEDTGIQYEQKPTTSPVDTDQLGTIYRITLTQGATSKYLESRFGVNGTMWYAYSNNYKEDNCGSIFDPFTGTSSPAPACGNSTISIRNSEFSGSLTANCIGQSQSDIDKCDQLIQAIVVSLRQE